MLTRKLGLGLLSFGLLVGLSACTKDDTGCDTAAGETCGDTDADTDADSDSDTDSDADADNPSYFEPYAVGFDWSAGFQDGGYTAWTFSDGTTQEPYVTVTLYEEAYFDAYDDRYSCTWYAYFTEVALDDMGIDGLWYGAEVELSAITDAGDCADFDPDVWGGTDPSAVFEANRFGIGFGPLGPNVSDSLEEAVGNAGLDWAVDWAPNVFSYYMSFTTDASASFADSESTGDYGYSFALEVEPDTMTIVTDADGNGTYIAAGGATEMPDPGYISARAWSLPYSDNFLP